MSSSVTLGPQQQYCRGCAAVISKEALACPSCGAPIQSKHRAGHIDQGNQWIPFYRRQWFIVLCLLTISPVALLPLLTGKVYRKQSGDGLWVPIKGTSRAVYLVLSLWLIAAGVYGAMNQAGVSPANDSAQSPAQATEAANPAAPSNDSAKSDSADNSDAELDTSDLKVEAQPTQGMGTGITVTSTSDSPITVARVVVNNRENTPGCDFSSQMNATNKAYFTRSAEAGDVGSELAFAQPGFAGKVLRTGDQLSLIAGANCGTPVKAEVFTDRGRGSYSFGGD
ncbi:MAG: hypothetical protein ACREHF_13660 [Rhizomicrobium sp.]